MSFVAFKFMSKVKFIFIKQTICIKLFCIFIVCISKKNRAIVSIITFILINFECALQNHKSIFLLNFVCFYKSFDHHKNNASSHFYQ